MNQTTRESSDRVSALAMLTLDHPHRPSVMHVAHSRAYGGSEMLRFFKRKRLLESQDQDLTSSRGDQVKNYKALCGTKQFWPRVIALSMVKNEQDIIEPFIRHNIQFVDVLIIVDNGSVDRTKEIALMCARELGNIVVSDVSEFAYNQANRMSRLLHYCQASFFADYVVFIDADEFIGASSRSDFESEIDRIPENGIGLIPWRTFVVKPEEGSSVMTDPPRSFANRRKVERPLYYKAILRLDGRTATMLSVAQGNHLVLRNESPLPQVVLGFPLMHFPVRNAAQLASKAVVGWTANLARDDLPMEQAYQWRTAFDEVASGGLDEIDKNLSKKSLAYAQTGNLDFENDVVTDPFNFNYKRLYSNGASLDPLITVARSWERTFRAPGLPLPLKRPEKSRKQRATKSSFDASWHWDNLFLDAAPFRYIAEKYQPKSVFDVGCGIGQYLSLFKTLGAIDILGIDGIPEDSAIGVLDQDEFKKHDLSQPFEAARSFDLVICVEVAEHLEDRDCEALLNTVAQHAAARIVFSAAEPGQPGHGHINCQQIGYWLKCWSDRGWIPDLVDTLGMRALATMSWFRRNLIMLRPGTAQDGKEVIDALISIGEKPYTWYSQSPGIRSETLSEAINTSNEGYG